MTQDTAPPKDEQSGPPASDGQGSGKQAPPTDPPVVEPSRPPTAAAGVGEVRKAPRERGRETRRERAAGSRYYVRGNLFMAGARNEGTIVGGDQNRWEQAAGATIRVLPVGLDELESARGSVVRSDWYGA